jgi:hypothetical protein
MVGGGGPWNLKQPALLGWEAPVGEQLQLNQDVNLLSLLLLLLVQSLQQLVSPLALLGLLLVQLLLQHHQECLCCQPQPVQLCLPRPQQQELAALVLVQAAPALAPL